MLHGLDHPVCIPGGAVKALPSLKLAWWWELLTVISVPYKSPSMVMMDRRMGWVRFFPSGVWAWIDNRLGFRSW